MISIVMYVLWILCVVAILATTFTEFQYEDLNFLAVALLIFAVVNSVFTLSRKK